MTGTTLNWLLIGAGDIARKRVAPALADTDGSRLHAVCDLDADMARSLAGVHGAERVYADHRDALADRDVDAVYIATPVHTHVPLALDAIAAGKHVLAEKPLGLDGADADRAVSAASGSGLVCGCAYFRRLSRRYLMLRDMLRDGALGRVVLARMAYFSWFDPAPDDPKHWRVVRAASGGGPLSDMGSHMFDMLLGLLGMPDAVSAMTATIARDWDVEDSVAAAMRMEDGALATASFNWNSRTWVHMFEVVGAEAKVLWQPCDAGPVVRTVGRDIEELDLPPAANVHQPLVGDFVSAVREGREPACPFTEAARTNRLMDAVYRAATEHREVAP